MAIRSVAGKCSMCVVAGAIGAGLALLFAPRSGQQTRTLIRHRAEEYAQDAGKNVAEKTREFYSWGKHVAARRLRRTMHAVA